MDPEALAAVRKLVQPETEAIERARERTTGASVPADPEVGALLAWAASVCRARTVVEIGSGGGVSALWVLPALRDSGMVTVIEPDPHAHVLASDAYTDGQVTERVRLILGEPDLVLPRLSDGGYDLMVIQSPASMYPGVLDHARRLLRTDAMLVVRCALRRTDRPEQLAAFLEHLLDDEVLDATVLPLDDGLVLAFRGHDPEDG